MSEKEKELDDSVILDADFTRLIPSLDSIDPIRFSELAAKDPAIAALYQQNKHRESQRRDQLQDQLIKALAQKVAKQSEHNKIEIQALNIRLSSFETERIWIKGALAAIVIVWTSLTWIIPKLFSQEDAKMIACQKINVCLKENKDFKK